MFVRSVSTQSIPPPEPPAVTYACRQRGEICHGQCIRNTVLNRDVSWINTKITKKIQKLILHLLKIFKTNTLHQQCCNDLCLLCNCGFCFVPLHTLTLVVLKMDCYKISSSEAWLSFSSYNHDHTIVQPCDWAPVNSLFNLLFILVFLSMNHSWMYPEYIPRWV